jgi:hypothetical protein
MKKILLYAYILTLAFTAPVFAKDVLNNEFTFRLMPRFTAPVGVKNFEQGFGAGASFDWSFVQFPRNMSAGFSLAGGFSQLGTAVGSAFNIFEGALGPFFHWRILDRLSLGANLSAGVYNYRWNDDSNSRVLFGIDISAYYHLLPSIALFASGGYTHYAFSEDRPINTFVAGLGVSLNLGELLRPQSRVQAEKTEQQRVFPVSYAWYEKNSIATVKITNNEPNAITDMSLTFFLEQYMNQGTLFATIPRLLPGESVEVQVTALFNESMLDLTENIDSNAFVRIDYRSLGAKRQASFAVQMPIYHRNAMNWDDDRRAASFVSARDPAASLFSKYTDSAVKRYMAADPKRFASVPENVVLAAALFEALNLYGINYVIDPASSYIELSDNVSALDSLNYPYQTLLYRGGDCDDLSILFCSLLEVLDIPTAFITLPGHIYMAFEVGHSSWGSGNIVEYGGKRWLPVEITILGRGFAEAWRIGVREWKSAGGILTEAERLDSPPSETAIYPMRESWELYRPVSVPGAGDRLPSMPTEGEILRRLEIEAQKLR